jgi:hypothetical protein
MFLFQNYEEFFRKIQPVETSLTQYMDNNITTIFTNVDFVNDIKQLLYDSIKEFNENNIQTIDTDFINISISIRNTLFSIITTLRTNDFMDNLTIERLKIFIVSITIFDLKVYLYDYIENKS